MKEALGALGMNVKCEGYAEEKHWIQCPKGFDDIVAFLQNNVGVPVAP